MPELDGLGAIAQIKAAQPEIEIVALTSFIEEEKVTTALEAGATGYLLKDADADDVAAAVRAAHAGEVHLDPAVTRLLAQRMRARRTQPEPVEPLTERELEVLSHLGRGSSNKEIASALTITERTARTHVSQHPRQARPPEPHPGRPLRGGAQAGRTRARSAGSVSAPTGSNAARPPHQGPVRLMFQPTCGTPSWKPVVQSQRPDVACSPRPMAPWNTRRTRARDAADNRAGGGRTTPLLSSPRRPLTSDQPFDRGFMRVRKAVFPAAGWGTRFLPATKAQPKEMLPLVDKPIIQYAVEEAVAAGIEQVIIVTSSQKRAIEDHFDLNYELERLLEDKGDIEMLRQIRHISDLAQVAYVRQKEQLGLGPRRADGEGARRPRAVRGHPLGRRRRRRPALHRPADARLRAVPRLDRRRHGGPARGDQPVRRDRHRHDAPGIPAHAPRDRPRREARARRCTLELRDHRPLRADAHGSSKSSSRRRAAPAARSSSRTRSTR